MPDGLLGVLDLKAGGRYLHIVFWEGRQKWKAFMESGRAGSPRPSRRGGGGAQGRQAEALTAARRGPPRLRTAYAVAAAPSAAAAASWR